jgi:HAD superfamily hydrolase (TIGR01458 family)
MDARLARVRGFLLDLDGTLIQDGRLLPGIPAALEAIRAAGLGIRFVTNTSRRARRSVVEGLREAGLSVAAEEVLTAPVATVSWLRERGIRTLALLVPPAAREDFAGFEIVEAVPPSDERDAAGASGAPLPGAVVVGDLGQAWSYAALDAAFGWLLEGAELVAIQRNRYWKTGGALHLDAGPFVAALEYASSRPAVVTGKPSPLFFEAAARSMGLTADRVAMVGDDIEADVQGARSVGAVGILARTGKFRHEDLRRTDAHADVVLGTAAELAALVGD